jgi:double-stranded uracil-DNA glycosylase
VTESPLLQGLPALCDAGCRVLVLGSMPGAASLAAARYYAHPRNRFWPLMARLLGFDAALDYPQRVAALQAGGVGVWDVIAQCVRPGSLDAAIDPRSVVPNDIAALARRLPQLRAVACNGAAAAQAWRRHVAADIPGLAVLALPSTSPANAAFSLDRLQAAWQPLLAQLAVPPR